MATEAPVPMSLMMPYPSAELSTTACMLARQEPSLISRKENSLASRRVRTQPLTTTCSLGPVAASSSEILLRFMAYVYPGLVFTASLVCGGFVG